MNALVNSAKRKQGNSPTCQTIALLKMIAKMAA
jgi:hypothetical protein